MKTKTITINIPEPGDELPFVVLEAVQQDGRSEWVGIMYELDGRLRSMDGFEVSAVAALLGIPSQIQTTTTVKFETLTETPETG